MDVGKRISELRDLKGFTTNKLANKAGISQSFLRDIELSKKKPTVETLEYICDALEISLKDFFDIDLENKYYTNELFNEINRLTTEQRNALISFLKQL